MKVDRRDFLKIIGLGTAGTAASGCTLQGVTTALQLTEQELRPPNGPESWVASTCGACSGSCGVLVRKIGARAVKVEGNPLHPVNRGRLCPVGQASLQLLYHPDRLRSPLKRVGERGSGKWQKISWEEALSVIASKLKELSAKGESHKLAVLTGNDSELADRLMARFLDVYGSPNFVSAQREDPASLSQFVTQGIRGRVAYDLENANYILSFAAPIAEGWMSPVRQMRALAFLRQGRPGRRGKLVQIESRLSATAGKADEWIAIRPGTEGILALGIAHVLIREDLYDRAFVEGHVAGFEDWADETGNKRKGFKSMVLEQYPPKKVAEMTGASADVIERLAGEFARAGSSLALCGDGLLQHGDNARSAVVIQALNALVGNIDKPGGLLVRQDPPLSHWSQVKKDRSDGEGRRPPSLGSSTVDHLGEAILTGKPYQTKVFFALGSNPVFSAPASFREALKKVPFVVTSSLFLDETAEESDLVLPDCTALERWDVSTETPGFAVMTVGIGQPALPPLHASKPAAGVVLELAKALGGSIAAAFPWKEPMEAIRALAMGLHRTRRGVVFTDEFQEEHLRSALREWVWASQDYPTFEDFWKDIIDKGGWVDPYYKYGDYTRTLRTASGKFELSSLAAGGLVSRKEDKDYPFDLYLFKPLAFMNEASAALPFLQEIAGSSVHSPWDSWVEINPKRAKELGIKDGDWVFVESSANKLKTRARLFSGTMPGVVNVPLGQGHTAMGRWAKGRGINPLSLFKNGAPTKVRISKA